MLCILSLLPLFLAFTAALPTVADENSNSAQNPYIRIYNWCSYPLHIWDLYNDGNVYVGQLLAGHQGSATIPSSRSRSIGIQTSSERSFGERAPAMRFVASLPPEDLSQVLFYWLKNLVGVAFKEHTVTVGGFVSEGKACPRVVWKDGGGDAGREESGSCAAETQWLDVMFCDEQASGQARESDLWKGV